MLSKIDLSGQMDAKCGILKECKRYNDKCICSVIDGTIYGAPDNTPGIAPKGVLQDLQKDAQKGAPENALQFALQVALESHLPMQLSIHQSVQNDSIKSEIEEVLYAALEGAPNISLQGAVKLA